MPTYRKYGPGHRAGFAQVPTERDASQASRQKVKRLSKRRRAAACSFLTFSFLLGTRVDLSGRLAILQSDGESKVPSQKSAMSDPRLDKLAEVLVPYSTGVRRGELVSLHGPILAEPVSTALYRQVLRAGGHPAVYLAPEACARILLQEGSPEQLSFLNPLDVREVEAVDVAIHVLASENTRALTNIDPGKQALRSKARRPAMDIFLRRSAEHQLRWVATPLPCQAAAQEAEMALDEYENFVFGAG